MHKFRKDAHAVEISDGTMRNNGMIVSFRLFITIKKRETFRNHA